MLNQTASKQAYIPFKKLAITNSRERGWRKLEGRAGRSRQRWMTGSGVTATWDGGVGPVPSRIGVLLAIVGLGSNSVYFM
jgi:hypothetical protein